MLVTCRDALHPCPCRCHRPRSRRRRPNRGCRTREHGRATFSIHSTPWLRIRSISPTLCNSPTPTGIGRTRSSLSRTAPPRGSTHCRCRCGSRMRRHSTSAGSTRVVHRGVAESEAIAGRSARGRVGLSCCFRRARQSCCRFGCSLRSPQQRRWPACSRSMTWSLCSMHACESAMRVPPHHSCITGFCSFAIGQAPPDSLARCRSFEQVCARVLRRYCD